MIRVCDNCKSNHFPMKDHWFEDRRGKWSKFLCTKCIDKLRMKSLLVKEELIKMIEKPTLWQKLKNWWQKQ